MSFSSFWERTELHPSTHELQLIPAVCVSSRMSWRIFQNRPPNKRRRKPFPPLHWKATGTFDSAAEEQRGREAEGQRGKGSRDWIPSPPPLHLCPSAANRTSPASPHTAGVRWALLPVDQRSLSTPALKDHGWHGLSRIRNFDQRDAWSMCGKNGVMAHPSDDFERIAPSKLRRHAHEVRTQFCISEVDHFRGIKLVILAPAFGFLIARPCENLTFIVRCFPKRQGIQIFGLGCSSNAIEFAFIPVELIEGSALLGGIIHVNGDLN